MSNSPFEDPGAAGPGIEWSSLLGSLLVIEALGDERDIKTVHGPANAVRANVTVLDGAEAGTVYDDTLIFPKILSSQLRTKIGRRVLGRLGQGVAKPGQSAPWVLQGATPADQEIAGRYLAKVAASGVAPQPQYAAAQAPAAAPAQSSPWG